MPARALLLTAAALLDCDELVGRRPAEYASYQCYLDGTRAGASRDDAIARLEGRLALDPGNPLARVVLARIQKDAGDPRAELNLRRAADGFAAGGMPLGEVYARLDLVDVLDEQGRGVDAQRELERALGVAEASRHAPLIDAARTQQAWMATRRADYSRAEALFSQLEREALPRAAPFLRSSILSGSGSVFWATGQDFESLDRFRRLAGLHHEQGNLFAEAADRHNMALASSHLVAQGSASPEEVRALHREALALARRSGNRSVESSALLALATEPDVPASLALQLMQEALELARSAGDAAVDLEAMRSLAWLRLEIDPAHPGPAFAEVDRAVAEARRRGSLHHVARGEIVRSALVLDSGTSQDAIRQGLAALDAIERIRGLQADDLVRARFASQWAFFYYRLAGYLLGAEGWASAAYDPDLAVEVMERLRGRVLADLLELAGAPAAGGPAFRPGLARIQESLASDQALVAYQLSTHQGTLPGRRSFANGGSWAVAITRHQVTAHRLADEPELESAVSSYLGMIQRRDGSEAEGSRRLYDELLRAPLSSLGPGVRRLVLIPDKILHRLPFETLRSSEGEPPAGTLYEISEAPSIALWMRWRADGAGVASHALVLADPAAPVRLVHARREARDVRRLLGSGTTILTGEQASETALKRLDLSRIGLLHLAAHGLVNEALPERSALHLSPGSALEDGLLEIREVVGLRLQGAIVVLPACRSSAGTILRGEGALSLARAFFQAGARTVVASLWPLRDDEAGALMAGFYRELARGGTVSASMARSRLELIRAGAPAAAWAGLVVLGDGEAGLARKDRPESAPGAAAGLLAGACGSLLAAALLFRRLR